MENKFLSQMDLATRWNISCKTLEKWRWVGSGPRYAKFGNMVRYGIDDIEAFEASKFLKSTTDEYLKKSKLNK